MLAVALLCVVCMLHYQPVQSKCIEGVYDKYPDCLFENNAIKPTPKIENDWYDWWERHHTIVKHKKRINPEIVLIGDSITHRFGGFPEDVGTGKDAWEYLFQKRKVLNLGFGWDRTQNVLWRLYNGEYEGLKPGYVVVNIGTNNLTPSSKSKTRANSPYEIVEAIKLIVQIVQENSPDAKLIIMGIFPREGKKYQVQIEEINERLKTFISTLPNNVAYLDLSRKFANRKGEVNDELYSDGVHPTDKGYWVWARGMKHMLEPAFWATHKNPLSSDANKEQDNTATLQRRRTIRSR